MAKMRVVMVPAERLPYVTNIEETLENMQKTVGGYIEAVTMPGGIVIICNEEGRLMDLPINQNLRNFCGDVFICKADGEELVGLEPEEALKMLHMVKARRNHSEALDLLKGEEEE